MDDKYTTELSSIVDDNTILGGPKNKAMDLTRAMVGRMLPYGLSNPLINSRFQQIDANSEPTVNGQSQRTPLLRDMSKMFTASHSPAPEEWSVSGLFPSQPIPSSGKANRLLLSPGLSDEVRAATLEEIEKIISAQSVPVSPPTERIQQAYVERGNTDTTPTLAMKSRVISTSADAIAQAQPLNGMAESKTPYELLGGGIQLKKRTRATLRLRSAPSRGISSTANFFLTDVREVTNEKFQIIQTFGADFMFAFGSRPLMYTFSGVVYNTEDKQWKNNLRFLYDNKFRATQLIKAGRRAVLSFEDVTVEGYLLNMDMSLSSQNPHAVPFSFTMYITKDLRGGVDVSVLEESVKE